MNAIKKSLIVAMAATSAALGGAQTFDLSDFVLSKSRPSGIPATQPARDGNYYYQQSADGTEILKLDYSTGQRSSTVLGAQSAGDDGVAAWDGYTMSADESKILLWQDTHMIYRHSFSADYYVYDVKSRRLTKLSQAGGEEIATFSPDGQRVAYVKDNNIYLKNLTTGETATVTTDGVKNRVINGVPDWVYQEEFGILNSMTFSPDGRTLAFLRFDESQVPMYSMTIYQGACSPNDAYELYPGSYDYKYPVAGQKNSVVSVMAYDVASGKLSTLPVPKADDDYIPHIAFAQDNSKLMVSKLNRTQNDFHIYAVNPATGEVKVSYHETTDYWIDSEMANQVKYYDHWFVIPSDKSGHMQLYWCEIDGSKQLQFTQGDEDVTAYYGYDEKRQRFYFQTTAGPQNRQVKYIDKDGVQHNLTGAEGTYGARFSSNYSYWLRTYSSATVPTQYAIYNAAGKHVRDLELNSDYAEKYTSKVVPKREFFSFEKNGVKLNGFMIKPAHFDPSKKYPVIMVQYSGPGAQLVLNRWSLDWEEYAAMQGYIVACVDGRGTGGRGADFEHVVYRRLGHYESIDQIAASDYMASLPYVDKDRIGIWGWSYGGYEALMAMSTPGSHYKCGVAIAPVISWKYYDTIYAERYMRTPQENPSGYKDGAPLEATDKLKGRVLIMFGSADDNVHIVNEMQYISKLQNDNVDFDMHVWTNMNHSINGCDVRLPLYRKVMSFYDQYLKGNR